ncbi:MAG: hypothetical protein PHQ41_03250 [Candidatus Cloacimonetes bacterium]|nr:hypothetical protein [Candidatus Cloacimonadota bacterium]
MNTFARRAKSQLKIYQSGNREEDQNDQAKAKWQRQDKAGGDSSIMQPSHYDA